MELQFLLELWYSFLMALYAAIVALLVSLF